jgi:2-polyprenyl-3-methyl-5-hydroxy-6-metoxy-1,4-benzoquinol methylase
MPGDDAVAAAWDAWHSERDELDRRHELPEAAVWRELALRRLPDLHGLAVLDCGSARGGFSRALADRGASVTAIDTSSVAVRLTEAQLAGAGRVLQADARRLPIPDATFDVVVCLQTLNYVRERSRLLAELVRVAKPGGRLVVSVLNHVSPLGASRVALELLGRDPRPPFESGMTTGSLLRLLSEHGVELENVDCGGYAVVVPGLSTFDIRWLARLPFADRLALHVCVAARMPAG